MMKLYYAPGACSLSPHIALREAGLPFELLRVDFMRGKRTGDGQSFVELNPKGYVPALVLEDGQLLTEGVAIVQYIADLVPEAGLAPRPDSFERVRLQEWLNFIATELHKGLAPLYSPKASDEYKQSVKEKLAGRFALLQDGLKGKRYLMSERFTVADGYALYAMRAWQKIAKATLPPALEEYYARIVERPAVRAALEAESST